jgi:glutamate-5-semialdehyde dehydrogenase
MNIAEYMLQIGKNARDAATILGRSNTQVKNAALAAIADELETRQPELLAANAQDLAQGKANGLESAMLDRLTLNEKGIAGMIEGLRQVIALPDPIGCISDLHYRPAGFQVGKMRVPLGVVGIIYEARPNVTIDAASLCLKSGNATILRGGSEAIQSNQAIAKCIAAGLEKAGLPATAVQVI